MSRRTHECISSLMTLDDDFSMGRGAARDVIDVVLACDKMISCGKRLECTWLAARMADKLRTKAA